MSDTAKNSRTLTIEAGFKDGDTRSITLDNPITNTSTLTASIKALGTFVKNNNLLIGDKAGADFDRFNSAKVKQRTTVYLDLASA